MTKSARATTAENSGLIHGATEVLSLIGDTSLVRFARIRPSSPAVEVYAKAEWENPGGSVKDRPALNIVREAEAAGSPR